MKKFILAIFLMPVISQAYFNEMMYIKGNYQDTYAVFITSRGTKNPISGTGIKYGSGNSQGNYDGSFASTTPIISKEIMKGACGDFTDWEIYIPADGNDVYIGSSSVINTALLSATNVLQGKRPILAGESYSPQGKCSQLMYGRIKATLAGWTTAYITITAEER